MCFASSLFSARPGYGGIGFFHVGWLAVWHLLVHLPAHHRGACAHRDVGTRPTQRDRRCRPVATSSADLAPVEHQHQQRAPRQAYDAKRSRRSGPAAGLQHGGAGGRRGW